MYLAVILWANSTSDIMIFICFVGNWSYSTNQYCYTGATWACQRTIRKGERAVVKGKSWFLLYKMIEVQLQAQMHEPFHAVYSLNSAFFFRRGNLNLTNYTSVFSPGAIHIYRSFHCLSSVWNYPYNLHVGVEYQLFCNRSRHGRYEECERILKSDVVSILSSDVVLYLRVVFCVSSWVISKFWLMH